MFYRHGSGNGNSEKTASININTFHLTIWQILLLYAYWLSFENTTEFRTKDILATKFPPSPLETIGYSMLQSLEHVD